MNIREMFTELCTESERENQKRPVRPRAAFIVMGLLSLVVGAALFLIATLAQDGVSFSRIDYSGHGFCGWAALFCSCVFIGGIISILALWFLRLNASSETEMAVLRIRYHCVGLALFMHRTPLPRTDFCRNGFGCARLCCAV